jgi:bacterioferritin-associated ferredoxin
MIICICKNVSDRALKVLVAEGNNLQQIIRASGAGTGCGQCLGFIEGMLKDHMGLSLRSRCVRKAHIALVEKKYAQEK